MANETKVLNRRKKNINNSEAAEHAEHDKRAPEGEKMVRYLIRRQNRYGQWVHIDTIESLPLLRTWESYLRNRHGPGTYHIAQAQEGVAGLRSLEGQESVITIEWKQQYMGMWPDEPKWEELVEKCGIGDYIIARLSDLNWRALKRNGADDSAVKDIMDQGISAFMGKYVVFKLLDVPYQ